MATVFFYILLITAIIVMWHVIIKKIFDRIPSINKLNKTCIVTGASSGIGSEIAKQMVAQGWTVIGIARRHEKLKDLERQLGSLFIPLSCDISNKQEVHQVCNDIKQRDFKPTMFFLNAGIGEVENLYAPMFPIHKQTFDTNYFGVISWIDEWISEAKKCGGATFIATSSMVSLFAGPRMAGYTASKAAINECFHSLRFQYRTDNIGFVVAMPGPVQTAMLKKFDKQGSIINMSMPFTHKPSYVGRFIVKHVFKREKRIEVSFFYSWVLRLFNILPDAWVAQLISFSMFQSKHATYILHARETKH